MKCLKAGFPNLWDIKPDTLRSISCNNNRNKVYNKCNVLESSPNHPPLPSVEKLFHTQLTLVQKRLGTPAKEYTHTHTHTECITRFITNSGLKREEKKVCTESRKSIFYFLIQAYFGLKEMSAGKIFYFIPILCKSSLLWWR